MTDDRETTADRQPLVMLVNGALEGVLAPISRPSRALVEHAPRLGDDEHLVFSAADVDEVHSADELDTDHAIALKAAFASGAVDSIRLVRRLPGRRALDEDEAEADS